MIKRMKTQKGFTLIELMVVIVIIGILVAIALPNFIGAQDRAKISSVKANMHTVQTMLETYGVDWGGTYPSTVSQLVTEAVGASNPYYKDFTNPFTSKSMGATGSNVGNGMYDLSSLTTNSANAGLVGYEDSGTTKYFLYGNDKVGAIIKDKGNYFVLTNS